MRSLISKLKGLTELLLLTVVMMVSMGSGSAVAGFTSGGFTGRSPITIEISADRTTLQVNPFGAPPNPGGLYTNTISIQVKQDGKLFNAPSVNVAIVSGLSSGVLFRLDGTDEEDEDGNIIASRNVVYEDTGGVVTTHLHALSVPGPVVISASAADPQTNQVISANLIVEVGPGVSTGQPAVVSMLVDASPLYITGQGFQDVKRFQATVLDDANQPVPNPTGNNLRLQLLPNRPNGGERLSALTISGALQEGLVVNTRTINGVAEAALHSGILPGTAQIEATADRADNNVDNGIQSPITDVQTIPMSSGVIRSLTFTGPYPGAVAQRRNTLPLGDGDSINFATGVYSRAISVIAADEFGNPPPDPQSVTFRLMDGPMTGYPDGPDPRGTFTIAGTDGNPQEGLFLFSTPDTGSSLAGAALNCQLVLEGGADQTGGWIITGVSGLHLLSVNTPFNSATDTGFTVPYTVGCPPYAGNVANIVSGVTVQTDVDGLAATFMNYPINQLGRRFKLTAEADGGQVGAVLSHWYLGIPTGSTLTVIPASDLNVQVPVGEELIKTFTLQLFDGAAESPAPLPAERLDVQTIITDPDHDAFLAAEVAVEIAEVRVESAQAALDSFVADNNLNLSPVDVGDAEPTDCFIRREETTGDPPVTTVNIEPNPGADQACATVTTLQGQLSEAQTALANAQAQAAEAEVRDELFTTTATFTPNPLATGANGIANMIVTVSDLYTAAITGGAGDAKVQFLISTVGPEILAETITITITPQAAAAGGE